ncbi:MAG: hypothetical protein KOO63_08080 [Bacteroidales bacterium]|nr:hypothetical protein [Candidatus Latescibacterota bacterium]
MYGEFKWNFATVMLLMFHGAMLGMLIGSVGDMPIARETPYDWWFVINGMLMFILVSSLAFFGGRFSR